MTECCVWLWNHFTRPKGLFTVYGLLCPSAPRRPRPAHPWVSHDYSKVSSPKVLSWPTRCPKYTFYLVYSFFVSSNLQSFLLPRLFASRCLVFCTDLQMCIVIMLEVPSVRILVWPSWIVPGSRYLTPTYLLLEASGPTLSSFPPFWRTLSPRFALAST